jgi:hypothetical protein
MTHSPRSSPVPKPLPPPLSNNLPPHAANPATLPVMPEGDALLFPQQHSNPMMRGLPAARIVSRYYGRVPEAVQAAALATALAAADAARAARMEEFCEDIDDEEKCEAAGGSD